ncbi:MAG: hypothetical protein R3E01_29780 [Pirellulaceae bacterium]|nr:hypothetical protein [Planctomycetales bacterium]
MVKKALFLVGGFVLLIGMMFGRDAFSYARTSMGWVKDSVKNSVPVEFEIERARKAITELQPEIRRNMHVIAKEEVEVERLNEQVARLESRLTQDRDNIMEMKADLQKGGDHIYYASRRYTSNQVRTDLAARFERYKTNDATLNQLTKVLEARRNGLDGAREKLDEMLSMRRQLEVEIANLEARQKMVDVAKTASRYQFDDSQLSRVKELVSDIQTRIEVEEKLMAVEGDFQYEIPVEQVDDADIEQRVAEYFGTIRPEVASVAELHP